MLYLFDAAQAGLEDAPVLREPTNLYPNTKKGLHFEVEIVIVALKYSLYGFLT